MQFLLALIFSIFSITHSYDFVTVEVKCNDDSEIISFIDIKIFNSAKIEIKNVRVFKLSFSFRIRRK